MTPETKKLIHRIYGICFSAIAIWAGICFIAACCVIYFTGLANDVPQIYTRAIVADAFGKIALPVYLCLAMVIGGFILHIALPPEQKKVMPEKNLPLILARLQARTELDLCDASLREDIATEKKQRTFLCMLCAVLLAIGSVIFLVFACNDGHWGSNSTPAMVTAMYMMIGCLTAPLALAIYAAYFNRKSILREIELMKQASAQAPKKVDKAELKPEKRSFVPAIQAAIVILGLVLVIVGACNQGTIDILNKAVAICTECVGLG
jgi:FtsH-binding integral membrane protein